MYLGGLSENLATLGTCRTTDEFVQAAMQLQHPFDDSSTVADSTKHAIFQCLTLGRHGLRQAREDLADEMQDDERRINAAMDRARESIVHDKKFLLYKSMCADAGIVVTNFWLT